MPITFHCRCVSHPSGLLATMRVSILAKLSMSRRRNCWNGRISALEIMSGTADRENRVHSAVQRSMRGAVSLILGSTPSKRARSRSCIPEVDSSRPGVVMDRCEHVVQVLQQLARVHDCDVTNLAPYLGGWDYDAELSRSAVTTVELYKRFSISNFRIGSRPKVRPHERVATAVFAMRKQAIQDTGAAVLHGDTHPGNAVLRESNGGTEVVLLDWGRARLGSPLGDVLSWLHSLRVWEPNARGLMILC